MSKRTEFSTDEIFRTIDGVLEHTDRLRANNLERMATVQNVNTIALVKERQRLVSKYGATDARVQRIDAKLQFSQGFTGDLQVELDKTKIQVPTVDLATWMIHGRVLKTPENQGIPGLTVTLTTRDGQWVRKLGYACTDERSYFAILYPPKEEQSTETAVSKPPLGPVFLMVSDANRRPLYRSSEALTVQPGQVIYREIFLSDREGVQTCTAPSDPNPTDVAVEVRAIDSPSQATVNQSVRFTATLNNDATPPINTQWTFGDGATAEGLTVTHGYNKPGTYNVTVIASNRSSQDSESKSIKVQAEPKPTKIETFSVAPMNPDIHTPIRFNATAQNHEITQYWWDFGDGNTADVANTTHTYHQPGTYTVQLIAMNPAGSDTRSLTLVISNIDPDVWLARGWVTDEQGHPLEGLVVSLYDRDVLFDDRLGTTKTDVNGDFAIAYRTEDFADLFATAPDLYIQVLTSQGQILYSSDHSVRCNAGRTEYFNITIHS